MVFHVFSICECVDGSNLGIGGVVRKPPWNILILNYSNVGGGGLADIFFCSTLENFATCLTSRVQQSLKEDKETLSIVGLVLP